MRNSVKKAAVTALVCVTAAGMMAGCGNKKLDGTKIAVTVNKQEIPFGVVSLAARMQQAQAEAMYKMYLGGGSDMSIWSTKMDDSDETYGENAVTTSVETVEKMCLEKEHASEYDVEITDDEQKALEEAAKNFMAANSDETIAELAVDEDMVKTFLELETYDVKMKDAIEAKADVKLDEKEYQQMSFSYASAKVSGDDLSDDDIKKNKENLQKFYDKVKEDPAADFNTLGDEISEDMTATTGTCPTYEEGDDSAANGTTYPDEVRTALRKLDEGALNEEIIKTDSVWYVVRLDSKNDKTATESKKESLTNTKKDDFYNDTTDGWKKKADIKEEKKLIKKIKITVVTPQQPKIKNITVKGNTVTVTYTKCKNATGYEILLGNKYKTSAGEKYPVKKYLKRTEGKNTVTVTFTNVKKGTWYVTIRAWNQTSKDKSRAYSPYSTMKKFKTKK